jgi:hypothetical protein
MQMIEHPAHPAFAGPGAQRLRAVREGRKRARRGNGIGRKAATS